MKEGQTQEPVGGMKTKEEIYTIFCPTPTVDNIYAAEGEHCDAMGHYGGSHPDGICPKCNKPWKVTAPLDVEALIKQVGYIKRNAEKVNEHTWKVYTEQILLHVEEIETTYSPPSIERLIYENAPKELPQSSTEEEKKLWEEVSKIVIKHYTSYNYTDQDENELQSKFKISKR